MHRFMIGLVAAGLVIAVPQRASANISDTFDTVDAVELTLTSATSASLVVTGLAFAGTTPVTLSFNFIGHLDVAMHCQKLALIAQAKPGKYRFGIGGTSVGGCKLTLQTP